MNPLDLGLAQQLMAGAGLGAPAAPSFDPSRPLGAQGEIADIVRDYLLAKARERDNATEALQAQAQQLNRSMF